ncbi:MAG: threonine synthase [Stackebrandtia sp.]
MNLPNLRCSLCARPYSITELAWLCACGGILDVERFTRPLPDGNTLTQRGPTLWRYREALPVPFDSNVSMGEGMTPLLPAPGLPGAWIKVDFLMPTLSFKDRGAVMLATLAKIIRPDLLIVDSSGNAGTAVAAYAARVELPCEIYVPAATSPGKLAQMRAHGADVRLVDGNREDTADAAAEAAGKPGVMYASHVYHPYFLHGTKTYAYELFEQLGVVPRALVLPVGNGTLLLGAYLGFRELVEQGLARSMPTIVGVQAAGCAPLAGAIEDGRRELRPVQSEPTIAEGIAIATPARGAQILAAVRSTGGTIVTVTDDEITSAKADLAACGFFVEPTSAVCWAALARARAVSGQDGALAALHGERVVIPLCGAGLKSAK